MPETKATLILGLFLCFSTQPYLDQEFAIRESLKPGTSVEVSTSLNVSGSVPESKPITKQAQSQTLKIRASGQSHYRERIIEVAQKSEIPTIARRYLTAS